MTMRTNEDALRVAMARDGKGRSQEATRGGTAAFRLDRLPVRHGGASSPTSARDWVTIEARPPTMASGI